MDQALAAALEQRQREQLYRRRLTLAGPQQPAIEVDGQALLAFCSNDYLGLANHPEVRRAFIDAAERYGVGSGASHLVNGHQAPHQALEEALAAFTGRPRALLYSTGYMANLGVIAALLGRRDAVFEDRLNHASLLDGGLLAQARFQRYRHNDGAHLERLLEASDAPRKLVVTDGVFSMDGDVADLPALAQSCRRQDAWLMVDDAHGFGVLGEQGGGVAEQCGLDTEALPILVGTLGKAFGTAGAFVAGSEALIETLIQFSRTYIYTTGQPPAVAAATLKALELLQGERWRREHLNALIARFRNGAEALGLTLMDSPTPIQPILLGSADRALAMSEHLRGQGILVTAIRPPTVPRDTARLRVTLSAAHSEADIDRLLRALARALEDLETTDE